MKVDRDICKRCMANKSGELLPAHVCLFRVEKIEHWRKGTSITYTENVPEKCLCWLEQVIKARSC